MTPGKLIPLDASKPIFDRGKGGDPNRPLTPPWLRSHRYFKKRDGTVYGIPKAGLTRDEINKRMAQGHIPLDDKLRPYTQRRT